MSLKLCIRNKLKLLCAVLLCSSASVYADYPVPATKWRYTWGASFNVIKNTNDEACQAFQDYTATQTWMKCLSFYNTTAPNCSATYHDNVGCNGVPSYASASVYEVKDCGDDTFVWLFTEPRWLCPAPVCNLPQILDPKTKTCTSTLSSKGAPDKSYPSSCNPISYGYGNKYLLEQDYSSAGTDSLIYTRTYNSTSATNSDNIGKQWASSGLRRSVWLANGIAYTFRSNGKINSFKPNVANTAWLPDADITDKLVEIKDAGGVRTSWTYTTDSTGEVETYDVKGKLLSITNRAGQAQSFTYNGSKYVVTDSLGRSLKFIYDASDRIKTMINPQGGVYTYAYSTDGNNNLVSVTYPDNKTKTYHYENTSFPNALTGITDENNSRYMTYTYDANGRAVDEISPTFGTNVNHYALSYNPGVSTTVTDPRGSVRTYNFTTILGVVKSTGQSQPAGSGCAASAAALTYDVNGNIASRTDFNGNKTTYAYDMTRNLETSRTEGLTSANALTPATRTITTSWHPTWRLPLTISEYNGGTTNLSNGSGAPTGTALRSTTNVYDSKGNITSITEADPVNSTSRTTTTTYTYSTAVPGLALTKVVDGPRTDVNDTTTYTYYPHDATCTPSSATPLIDPITNTSPPNLGCRGQLQSVANALNQTTTYDRYNHHGQIEQMTDANGLVTTSTYDLRQRLLTRTVGTETTTLVYDNVGQVTQLTLPDNSQLNYTYDAAHRLTDVQDNLGNKVHYTLDTEGNRTNETTTDPSNQLTKTLTRSYDALNRLQQVTGVE
jgi:YD repeat-containing protein